VVSFFKCVGRPLNLSAWRLQQDIVFGPPSSSSLLTLRVSSARHHETEITAHLFCYLGCFLVITIPVQMDTWTYLSQWSFEHRQMCVCVLVVVLHFSLVVFASLCCCFALWLFRCVPLVVVPLSSRVSFPFVVVVIVLRLIVHHLSRRVSLWSFCIFLWSFDGALWSYCVTVHLSFFTSLLSCRVSLWSRGFSMRSCFVVILRLFVDAFHLLILLLFMVILLFFVVLR